MSAFRWSLQRVLDVALQREELIDAELARLAAEVRACETNLRRRHKALADLAADVGRRALGQRLGDQQLMLAQWPVAQRELASLAEAIAAAQVKRQQVMQQRAEARRWRRRLEHLRDKALAAHRKEELAAEQKQMDDLAQSGGIRRRLLHGAP